MKLYGVAVYYKASDDVRTLKTAYDLQSFSFFQRASVQEFIEFTGRIIVERSSPCSRSAVTEKGHLCHAYLRQDGLSGVVVSDEEYPKRVAQTMLTKLLDEFSSAVPSHSWPSGNETSTKFEKLPFYLAKFQNPREADSMMKVQDEIDETKIILHQTIQAVLERGEKLDDLVEKSEGLSAQSKMFYKQARKMNTCCGINWS